MTANDISRNRGRVRDVGATRRRRGIRRCRVACRDGYLIEQFLNANVNQRPDAYGGSIEGRNRFALEVARATAAAIGVHRVGIRLSPFGAFNSTGPFPEVDAQYLALTQALS